MIKYKCWYCGYSGKGKVIDVRKKFIDKKYKTEGYYGDMYWVCPKCKNWILITPFIKEKDIDEVRWEKGVIIFEE